MRKNQIKLLDILDEYGFDIFSTDMLKDKTTKKMKKILYVVHLRKNYNFSSLK